MGSQGVNLLPTHPPVLPHVCYGHTCWCTTATCGWGRLFPSKDVLTGAWGEWVTYGRFTPLQRDSQAPPSFSGSLLSPRIHPMPPTLRITALAYSAVNSPFSNEPRGDEQYNRRLMDQRQSNKRNLQCTFKINSFLLFSSPVPLSLPPNTHSGP